MSSNLLVSEPGLSLFYFSLLGLLWLKLTIAVVLVRRKELIGIGTGGNETLARKVRCHGNFNEALIPFAILFLTAELAHANTLLLHGTAIAFIVGRLLHAYGLGQSAGASLGRVSGSLFSWTAILVLAINNLYWASAKLFA